MHSHARIQAHPYVTSHGGGGGSEIVSIILTDPNFSPLFSLVWIFISKFLFEVGFKTQTLV